MAELKIITMEDIPVTEVKWLWYPYIPYGKLTIIHGDPGDGKTMMILQLAAILSRGDKLPCDCLLYTSPSPRDRSLSRMPSSA